MKTPTKEAKIHLATVVDDYEEHATDIHFQKNGFVLNISEYNPNDPDSPYCMKYIKALWNGLSVYQVSQVCNSLGEGIINLDVKDTYKVEVGINSIINDCDNFIVRIARVTGFKGEVWA